MDNILVIAYLYCIIKIVIGMTKPGMGRRM